MVLSSKIKPALDHIIDVSLFVLVMIKSKNCSCLVSMSNDLDENMKSSGYVDIGDTLICSELSNNCALAVE